jgi:hypothetical protein
MWITYVLVFLSLQNRHLDDSGLHDYSEPLPTIRALKVCAYLNKYSSFYIITYTNMNITALQEMTSRYVTFTVSNELAASIQGTRKRQQILPKHWYPPTKIHFPEYIFIFTVVRTSNVITRKTFAKKKNWHNERHCTLHAVSVRKLHVEHTTRFKSPPPPTGVSMSNILQTVILTNDSCWGLPTAQIRQFTQPLQQRKWSSFQKSDRI